MPKRRAVFLDRDGTIVHEVNYLCRPEDTELLPGAGQAIAELRRAGFAVVVISNQSGVARGYFTLDDLAEVQDELSRQLAAHDASIDGWYNCVHHPKGEVDQFRSVCDCRKPEPGLILRAVKEMDLELTGSFMIGDRLRDVACGNAAGVTSILVRSGQDDGEPTEDIQRPDYVAEDLAKAAQWILSRTADCR